MAIIEKTEGIVIRRERFRSTSKMVTLFSKDYGRLSLLAKGGFDPKRLLGGNLEPFSLTEITFYYREGKEYHLISGASLIYDFPRFRSETERFFYASLLSSFIIKTLPKEVKQSSLYQLFLSTIFLLDRAGKESLIYSFLIKAASFFGYQPNLLSCLRCSRRLKSFFFSSQRGGFLCAACREGEGIDFQLEEARRLKSLLLLPQREVGKLELGEKEKEAIRSFLAFHLNFFFPNPPSF
jgi:DNA repair protein RecO (recombination protein O)